MDGQTDSHYWHSVLLRTPTRVQIPEGESRPHGAQPCPATASCPTGPTVGPTGQDPRVPGQGAAPQGTGGRQAPPGGGRGRRHQWSEAEPGSAPGSQGEREPHGQPPQQKAARGRARLLPGKKPPRVWLCCC